LVSIRLFPFERCFAWEMPRVAALLQHRWQLLAGHKKVLASHKKWIYDSVMDVENAVGAVFHPNDVLAAGEIVPAA